MACQKIMESDISFPYRCQVDPMGRVFFWQNKVLRAIKSESVDLVKEMLENGFIAELVQQGVFPDTKVTDYSLDGYALVLEHDKIPMELYPCEMSLGLLKKAAQCVLKVAELALQHGYDMVDCHLLNVLFRGNSPVYVDLGSFRKADEKGGWSAYPEFCRQYLYPLLISEKYSDELALKVLHSREGFSDGDYLLLTSFLYRIMPDFVQKVGLRIHKKYQYCRSGVVGLNHSYVVAKACGAISSLLKVSVKRLQARVGELEVGGSSRWGDYHDRAASENPRFDKVIGLINAYCNDAKNFIDIAGNQGVLSRAVFGKTSLISGVCVDLDNNAIDKGLLYKQCDDRLSFAMFNFMAPFGYINSHSPYERFRSDVSFCMALTHHLTLSQGYSFEMVASAIRKVTAKYAFVEFMPLGLWEKDGQNVVVPDWYSLENFLEAFKKHFYIAEVIECSTNRVLIFARVR